MNSILDDRMVNAIVREVNNMEQLPPKGYAGVQTKSDRPIPRTNPDTQLKVVHDIKRINQ